MKEWTRIGCWAAMASVGLGTAMASPVVLDFNAGTQYVYSQYEEDGFQLTADYPVYAFLQSENSTDPAYHEYDADPTGKTLTRRNWFGYTSLQWTHLNAINGEIFDLIGIDFATDGYNNYNSGGDILFSLMFADGSTSSLTRTIDNNPGLESFLLNQKDLLQISWRPIEATWSYDTYGNTFIQFDNILIDTHTSIPPHSVVEPESIALLSAGLMILSYTRRRNK